MSNLQIKELAIYCGIISLIIGAIIFAISWNVWGGGMPGYYFFLLPGNLVLSMLTEEINFWPKLLILLVGQFSVTAIATAILLKIYYTVLKANSS